MARYCSKCNRKIGFFEDDFDGMCRNCYEKQERIERNKNLEKKFENFKDRIIQYIPLLEIYGRITEVQKPLGLFENEYQSMSIILNKFLKNLIEKLPINFTKNDVDSINNMKNLLDVAEEMNYMLKKDYRVNVDILKKDENYNREEEVFFEYIGKEYFIFDIEEDYRYNDNIAIEMKKEQKHYEDYRS